MKQSNQTLVLDPGTPLVPGKLYLRLYHGRTNPEQEMDDWGFEGPVIGPVTAVVATYLQDIRVFGERPTDELWLESTKGMIVWEASYYGDFAVFCAGPDEHV